MAFPKLLVYLVVCRGLTMIEFLLKVLVAIRKNLLVSHPISTAYDDPEFGFVLTAPALLPSALR